MPVSYNKFMKHAENVTKAASETRPILKGVLHHQDGSLFVTDSHRLYKAQNVHSFIDERVINPSTGEQVEGAYPNIFRLLPELPAPNVLHIEDLKYTIDGVKALQAAGLITIAGEKKTPKNRINIKLQANGDGKLTLVMGNPVISSVFFLGFSNDFQGDFEMTFSSGYFLEALTLFKDTGYEQLEMHVFGKNRPFVITGMHDKDLVTLILPVRTGEGS